MLESPPTLGHTRNTQWPHQVTGPGKSLDAPWSLKWMPSLSNSAARLVAIRCCSGLKVANIGAAMMRCSAPYRPVLEFSLATYLRRSEHRKEEVSKNGRWGMGGGGRVTALYSHWE